MSYLLCSLFSHVLARCFSVTLITSRAKKEGLSWVFKDAMWFPSGSTSQPSEQHYRFSYSSIIKRRTSLENPVHIFSQGVGPTAGWSLLMKGRSECFIALVAVICWQEDVLHCPDLYMRSCISCLITVQQQHFLLLLH